MNIIADIARVWKNEGWATRAAAIFGVYALGMILALVTAGVFPNEKVAAAASLVWIGGIMLIVAVAALVLYFVPTIVAVALRGPNVGAAAVVNLFLGWTLLGWVAAFAIGAAGTSNRSAPVAA